jgi:hypothetical protein
VVGYIIPGAAGPTLDTYILSLLVDVGVPGLVFFFGMIACGIWIVLRQYFGNTDRWAAVGGPIACSLLAFAVYRTALSQKENHTLFFLIIGLAFAIGRFGHGRSAKKKRKRVRLDSAPPRPAEFPNDVDIKLHVRK